MSPHGDHSHGPGGHPSAHAEEAHSHEREAEHSFTPLEARQARRLFIVLVVVSMFFVVEFAGAKAAKSDVLQADALHLLMDVFALGASLFAMRLAVKRPWKRFTFGLRRAEPLAALLNAVLVLFAVSEILRDSIHHLSTGEPPLSNIMLVVAIAALVVNGLSAWLLHGAMHSHDGEHAPISIGHSHAHHHHDHEGHDHHDPAHDHPDNPHDRAEKKRRSGQHLNLRGAWLHLMGDTLGSLAALVAAIVIQRGGPPIVDPLASFLVVAILLWGALRLIRDAIFVLIEAAPSHLPVEDVRHMILAVEGVHGVHDLHVWTLGAGHDAVMTHVVGASEDRGLADRVRKMLRETTNARYVTVQIDWE